MSTPVSSTGEVAPAFQSRPLLLLVSGPAGSGKTTLCARLTDAFPAQIRRVITCTTRPPRGAERDGEDYHFFSRSEFEARVTAGEFLENALVHGNLYGTRKADVYSLLAGGFDLLLNLDVQGAGTVRETARDDATLRRSLVSLFLMPPGRAELEARLAGRGTETAVEMARRLRTAEEEMLHWPNYDYCLISGGREEDFERAKAVYLAEKMRVRHSASSI
ncbi:MAG: guanylate kinase [Puniceicoccales bacterium]|jgi:guanylate kinase|nr:guanylate kinase [Puniceicoccales bacterium]